VDPLSAADLGNFFGGGVSGYLIRRGWPLGGKRARQLSFLVVSGDALIPTILHG